jgi:hypothetical protein
MFSSVDVSFVLVSFEPPHIITASSLVNVLISLFAKSVIFYILDPGITVPLTCSLNFPNGSVSSRMQQLSKFFQQNTTRGLGGGGGGSQALYQNVVQNVVSCVILH